MLGKNHERTIKNGQSRDTDNIGQKEKCKALYTKKMNNTNPIKNLWMNPGRVAVPVCFLQDFRRVTDSHDR